MGRLGLLDGCWSQSALKPRHGVCQEEVTPCLLTPHRHRITEPPASFTVAWGATAPGTTHSVHIITPRAGTGSFPEDTEVRDVKSLKGTQPESG